MPSRIFSMGTEIFQRIGANITSRRLRTADVASEINETVTGIGLILFRNGVGQYALDFKRIFKFFRVKAESAADSYTVRVGNDTGDSENVAEQKVCNLTSDTGKFAEKIDVARKLSAVFVA